MSQTMDEGRSGEYRDRTLTDTAGLEGEASEGPFQLPLAGEAAYEIEGRTAAHTGSSAESPAEFFGYESPASAEGLFGEAPEATRPPAGLPEPDPYIAIRPALSPTHAHLPANEIAISFGHTPAIVALHQALSSPEPQQAALAVLLGRAGRHSLRANGSDVPIPAYLRLLSRLCREAAEHSEEEVGAPSGKTSTIRDVTTGSTGPDVREIQKALNRRVRAGLNPDGIFGPLTRTAVLNFQRANELQVDGIVGPQTRHALFPLVGVTVHAIGRFGAENVTAGSRGVSAQRAGGPRLAMEKPPGANAPDQPPPDDLWQLLLQRLPSTDPSAGPLDSFRKPSLDLDLPIPPLLTAPLLKIPGMQLTSRQVQPGFQFNTPPLWQSRRGSPNPSGSLVLALQSVQALNKEKRGHIEIAEGFQLGAPLFAQTSDGRNWTLQWFAQATCVDPFWQSGRWHLVQPFAQISAQFDLKQGSPTLGAGLFPVNVQFDLEKDKLSLFLQGGAVTAWDLAGQRVEIGGQAIGGVNITLGGK